ncbi:hypothetical protein CU254_35570 [Amycolatopsis sp. AA4]|uniref:hypothetical protein n=1 Tax=Actinomycetes TaxID=1760 RepID=UPI0001DEE936|nr:MULTISPECIES: hypothetical protein [Actinomycetes]ATY15125.1 hypothetical protein CU254_35570 [Amycolatopsis sp. AA4]EFL11340.1 predicted protein [Streptomyces sp. AA4]
MSEEQKETPEDKKKLRMTSVLAAALAAVTAALLGSTLGVAGTVIGAGVASVVSTVGGELYLRSLQRTRDAARKAMETAARRSRGGMVPVRVPVDAVRESAPGDAATVHVPAADLANMPTVRLRATEPEKDEGFGEKLRKMRWPLIIGSSGVAFVVALAVLLGLDWTTKGNVSTGLIPRPPDTSQQRDEHPDNSPSTEPQVPSGGGSRSVGPTSSPTTTPSAPPPSSRATEQSQAPSSSSKPSTSSQAPSGSQTPTAPGVPSNANE